MRARSRCSGDDVEIEIEAYDECNTVIDIEARRSPDHGGAAAGSSALVGVQSNQFPRALDLARQFRAAGVPVVVGGFHVSGCISMLPELPPDLQAALDLGVTCSPARARAAWPSLLRDVDAGDAEAGLQLSQRHAGHGGGGAAASCRAGS